MKMFSLRTLIDDIMLLVRNNNISESEDLSRAQITSWILAYKKAILKAKSDEDAKNGTDDETSLQSLKKTYGPLELEVAKRADGTDFPFTKVTKEKIPAPVDNNENNLWSVFDENGHPIQFMNEHRRHFHYFRKYTFGELTARYEQNSDGDGYVYVDGMDCLPHFNYIYLTGVFDDDITDDMNEEDIQIPDWMVPDIKNRIMQNELSFMLQRISDDDNNSTLDGIKPQPQTVIANEK